MIPRFMIAIVAAIVGFGVFAANNTEGLSSTLDDNSLIVADNRRKDRRDDREDDRDDKQDCRQEEGRVGDDKRECKQENRGDGDEGDADAEDDVEAEVDPEADA